PFFLIYSSRTWAMASGQESTCWPPCQMGWGQRIPLSCFTTWVGSTPDRRDREASLAVASEKAPAQPPALPMVVNTSQIPCSSELMVTYRVPQPVLMRTVSPLVTRGLFLGAGRAEVLAS